MYSLSQSIHFVTVNCEEILYGTTDSETSIEIEIYRVRYFRGRISNFNQSEARKHCFLVSDWLKFETLPRKYLTLLVSLI